MEWLSSTAIVLPDRLFRLFVILQLDVLPHSKAFKLEDPEVYFPHGTTPHPKNPTKPNRINYQLAEMYTRNLESLNIRDFVTKLDCPDSHPKNSFRWQTLSVSWAVYFATLTPLK